MRSMTTGYSDTTHGTFAQPPMSHGESYNMAELSPYDYSAAAGAAGIGAMGVNRARSMGSNNQTTPYNAFAAPAMPNPYEDPVGAYGQQQNQNARYRQPGPGGVPEMDLLDAAGLGANGYTAAHQAYGQPQNAGNLNRNPSLGLSTATSPSDYSSYGAHPPMPGYQQDYNAYQPNQPAQYNAYQQSPPQSYAPQAAYAAVPPQQQHIPETTPSPPRPLSTVSAADPYGGYVDEPMDARGSLPGYSSPPPHADAHVASPPPEKLLSGNFASPPASSEGHDHEDNRMSYQDEDDYAYEPRRVLKVRLFFVTTLVNGVDHGDCRMNRSQMSKAVGFRQVLILDDGCTLRGSVASSVLSLTRPPCSKQSFYLCPPRSPRRRPSNVDPCFCCWVMFSLPHLPRTNSPPRYPLLATRPRLRWTLISDAHHSCPRHLSRCQYLIPPLLP